MTRLAPKCFDDMRMAITNNGYLIPCCYCDDKSTMENRDFKKLLAVSNINDYEKIEDILKTKQWKMFYKNLKRNIGPPACVRTCAFSEKNKKRDEIHIDTKTKKVKHVRKV